MSESRTLMTDEVTLKRWSLYVLRFGLVVFAWTAVKLGFLDLATEYSTRVFVLPTFAEGIITAILVSTAIYGVETNSKKVKISIFVLLGATAIFAIADRVRDF